MIKHLSTKLVATIIIMGASILGVRAQQEPQYTQYMYNKLPINAGYTGSREVLSVRALYRNQWSGLSDYQFLVYHQGLLIRTD